jgi:hypothetical protein
MPFMPGMWISLIWISGCRQTKHLWISTTRRHGKHSGLRSDKTHQIATMTPDTVEWNNFAWNQKLTNVKDGQLEKVMQFF